MFLTLALSAALLSAPAPLPKRQPAIPDTPAGVWKFNHNGQQALIGFGPCGRYFQADLDGTVVFTGEWSLRGNTVTVTRLREADTGKVFSDQQPQFWYEKGAVYKATRVGSWR